MDEFESGFYDKERLEELRKARNEFLDALLDTGLGKLVVWCVEGLDRLLTMRAAGNAGRSSISHQKERRTTMSQILFIAAAIAFALDAFHVNVPAISWTPLGFCLLTIALWLL